MNTNLLAIVKQIIAEQGEDILDSPQRLKAFFSDLARDEPKPHKNAFIKCVEMKFPQILKNASVTERGECKKVLAKRLHEEEALILELCEETVELLAAVLFGETPQEPVAKSAAEGSTPPSSAGEVQQLPGQYSPGYVPQKKLTALLFCIFLGGCGAHRFYTGKIISGIGMLVLFLVAIFASAAAVGFFIFPVFVWWVVDIVRICLGKFTGKKGYPLAK